MAISPNQWNAYLSVLLQNMDTSVLDPDAMQAATISNPKEAGANFTRFLQNGCRLALPDLKIRPVPFDPATFPGLGEGWRLIAEEHDSRNDTLTEVDFNTVGLVSCLNAGETSIIGEEKLRRLKVAGHLRYGVTTFHGLWLDYQARKENSLLEQLFRLKKITYLDFLGDVLLPPGGDRHVLSLYRGVGGWRWDARWLAFGWCAGNVSAVSQVASV